MTHSHPGKPSNLLDKFKSLPSEKRTQIIGIAAIAIAALSSIAGYQASVRHQIRLSYEAQLSKILEKSDTLLNKKLEMTKAIKENPFSALIYMGELAPMTQEGAELKKQMNDLKYALDKTYGYSAYTEWYKANLAKIESYQLKAQ